MDNPIYSFSGDHEFLSNFHRSIIRYHGKLWPTAEHAYQAAKTPYPSEQRKILLAPTPGQAKRIGRSVTMKKGWEEKKVDVMRELVAVKFRIPRLRDLLLATGDATLVEGNTWGDTFWGACQGSTLGGIPAVLPHWKFPTANLYGENWLGIILMETGEELGG